MSELYFTFKNNHKFLGQNIMSYEQFCYMASQDLFKPYIDHLKTKVKA